MRRLWLVALALAVTPVAGVAQKGAAAGTVTVEESIAEAVVVVGSEAEGHRLVQREMVGRIDTPDRIVGVSFDGASIRFSEQADLVDESGLVRGYAVWEAESGEQMYVRYGYEIPPADPAGNGTVALRGTFEWIGGSGPLDRVRGKGTLEGKAMGGEAVELRWAGSYEQ